MQNLERYFDHAATTPVDPHVLSAMLPYFSDFPGNAHSLHDAGRRAHNAVETARQHVAELIGAEDPSQIVFTSGSTETHRMFAEEFRGRKVQISPFEHSSVRVWCEIIGATELSNHLEAVSRADADADLTSVILVNNETGMILDPAKVGSGKIHTDATQAVGKIPIALEGLDYLSGSAHKFYGPKGVGFAFLADGLENPLLVGGGQEQGLRSGTLNVPGIVGLGEAARIAMDRQEDDIEQAKRLNDILLEELSGLSDWRINGGENRSPFILSLSFLAIEGETLLIDLDQEGFFCSAGAACSSSSSEPSPILVALSVEPEWLRGTIRVSFGRSNSPESTHGLAKSVVRHVERLRALASQR